MHVITVFLTLLACVVAAEETKSCRATDDEVYKLFGTKTSYTTTSHKLTPTFDGCTPIQIFAVVRHGTRYPGAKVVSNPKAKFDMNRLKELRDVIVGNSDRKTSQLCTEDVDKFRDWKLDDRAKPIEKDGKIVDELLSDSGRLEMKKLGERLKGAFSDLLKLTNANKTNTEFKFRSTNAPRTISSMEEFMDGLLGESKKSVTPIAAPEKDLLLRANKVCSAWINDTKTSAFRIPTDTFANGTEMKKLIWDVSQRLGYDRNLTIDEVNVMYDMCRFEEAWVLKKTGKASPWCAAFSTEDLKTLEYKEDLDFYYYAGPGREINADLGYIPLKDMMDRFQKASNETNKEEPKGIFYFSHSPTLQSIYTALKEKKYDPPMNATNYKDMGNRTWRSSEVGAFGTNFVATLYKCGDSGKVEYKVSFHWAERLLKLDGCDSGLCSWETIVKKFEDQNKRNVYFCDGKQPDPSTTTTTTTTTTTPPPTTTPGAKGGSSRSSISNTIVYLLLPIFSLVIFK